MDVFRVRGRSGPHPAALSEVVDLRPEERELVHAVQAVNGADLFGPENHLVIQRDPQRKRAAVRLVNRKTGEVVSEVEPDTVIRLAR